MCFGGKTVQPIAEIWVKEEREHTQLLPYNGITS